MMRFYRGGVLMLTRGLLGLGLVSMIACGGGDDDGGGGATCAEAATAVGECGGDFTEAEFNDQICSFFRVSGECAQAIIEADCAEHDAEDPAYNTVCFPTCTGDAATCNDDDSITVCSEGTEYTFFCEAVCQEISDSPYTGTCAAEYMGMASESGMDTCWCEGAAAN
jgi:hypothetical protein